MKVKMMLYENSWNSKQILELIVVRLDGVLGGTGLQTDHNPESTYLALVKGQFQI